MRATGKCLDDDCVKLNARHHISLPRPWARLHFNINMRQRKCVIFVSCASLSMAKQIKSKFKHLRCWGSRGSHIPNATLSWTSNFGNEKNDFIYSNAFSVVVVHMLQHWMLTSSNVLFIVNQQWKLKIDTGLTESTVNGTLDPTQHTTPLFEQTDSDGFSFPPVWRAVSLFNGKSPIHNYRRHIIPSNQTHIINCRKVCS